MGENRRLFGVVCKIAGENDFQPMLYSRVIFADRETLISGAVVAMPLDRVMTLRVSFWMLPEMMQALKSALAETKGLQLIK